MQFYTIDALCENSQTLCENCIILYQIDQSVSFVFFSTSPLSFYSINLEESIYFEDLFFKTESATPSIARRISIGVTKTTVFD